MGLIGLIKITGKTIKINLQRLYQYHFSVWGVHTEVVFYDPAWKKIRDICKKRKMTWFVITPVNHDFTKVDFNNTLTKEEFSEILLKRYKEMEKLGQKIQLHVHLSMIDSMPYEKQKQMVSEALAWMRENGFKVSKFVPGWWNYTPSLMRVLKELKLRPVEKSDYYAIHDYDLISGNEHLW